MRKLLAKDIGPFSKVLAKMEVKEPIKQYLSKVSDKKKPASAELIGDLIGLIIDNYCKAEKELIAFLANVNDMTPEEIENLEIEKFYELVKELVSNINFFKSAA